MGQPFGYNAAILGAAVRGVPLTEVDGRPAEDDDGLAGASVQAIRRDTDLLRHGAATPLGEVSRTTYLARDSRPHFRPPEGTLKWRSAKELHQKRATGF